MHALSGAIASTLLINTPMKAYNFIFWSCVASFALLSTKRTETTRQPICPTLANQVSDFASEPMNVTHSVTPSTKLGKSGLSDEMSKAPEPGRPHIR